VTATAECNRSSENCSARLKKNLRCPEETAPFSLFDFSYSVREIIFCAQSYAQGLGSLRVTSQRFCLEHRVNSKLQQRFLKNQQASPAVQQRPLRVSSRFYTVTELLRSGRDVKRNSINEPLPRSVERKLAPRLSIGAMNLRERSRVMILDPCALAVAL
jgi:hypothetical protein